MQLMNIWLAKIGTIRYKYVSRGIRMTEKQIIAIYKIHYDKENVLILKICSPASQPVRHID
ncbi:MAG: hypothetical protein PWR27_2359 [Petroclostridium sp.]|nr:hypothetical protein [Petroclostridium sp.]